MYFRYMFAAKNRNVIFWLWTYRLQFAGFHKNGLLLINNNKNNNNNHEKKKTPTITDGRLLYNESNQPWQQQHWSRKYSQQNQTYSDSGTHTDHSSSTSSSKSSKHHWNNIDNHQWLRQQQSLWKKPSIATTGSTTPRWKNNKTPNSHHPPSKKLNKNTGCLWKPVSSLRQEEW